MPQSTTSHAVVFHEGEGYLLVRALQHGWKAQTYLVRSVADGRLYVRKKLAPDMFNIFPHNDMRFGNELPGTEAPVLVYQTEYEHVADALIFEYANGGDLRQLIDLYNNQGQNVPEDFIWHFLMRALTIFAHMHYAPRNDREAVDPLIHRDAWQGNFFLTWPDSPGSPATVLPAVLLGDWGTAQYVSEGDVGRGPTSIGNDIQALEYTFLTLCLGKPLYMFGAKLQAEVFSLLPTTYSPELRNVAVHLSAGLLNGKPDFANWTTPDTLELARDLIPLCETMLQRLRAQGQSPSDLRWTRPKVSDQPLFFDDQTALDRWCREHREMGGLEGEWSLVAVEKKSLRILRRSTRLNPGQFVPPSW